MLYLIYKYKIKRLNKSKERIIINNQNDNLIAMFETIVKSENKLQMEFIAKQKEYLNELNNMKIKIQRGEIVDTKQLIVFLQDSGIIDENGKLNEKYANKKHSL